MREREVKRTLRQELHRPGAMAAVQCGRAVIRVTKTTALALVHDGLVHSAYVGRVGSLSVTVLSPEPAALVVQPVPVGTGTDLSWASPGGRMGTLQETGK